MNSRSILLLLLVAIGSSCQISDQAIDPLFQKLETNVTGIDFVNTVTNDEKFNIFSYRNFYNGGGVAIGDINNDGLPDIYFTANMGKNKLYLNKGEMKFEDITDKAGVASENYWSTGVSMVDINNDGLLDIYVCNAGYKKGIKATNELYINNGDNTFTEMAEDYNLDDEGYTTHAVFFDYDGDGLLDCYILNNSFIPVNTLNYSNKRDLRAEDWPVKEFLQGGGDKLLKNTGNGFIDVSEEAGIYGSLIGFGLGVTVGDINQDGWLDIYVSNDFFERDYLYINKGDGTFEEVLTDQMQHISLSSMGADMADINNDGWPDIFVTDMLPYEEYRLKTTTDFENFDVYKLKVDRGFYHQFTQNTLQLNTGNKAFKEIAFHAGVAATDWSWGALMFDADNDGYSDILVCNGIYHDVIDQDFIDFFANDVIQRMTMSGKKDHVDSVISRMPSRPISNFIFKNNGDLTFDNMQDHWGLSHPSFSNGAAYADLDGDGDLDIIINNVNQPAFIYKNTIDKDSTKSYLQFTLIGPNDNQFAIGSSVKIYQGDQVLQRELIPNRGFQSSVDFKLHFGVNSLLPIDYVQVMWPDRQITKLNVDELNQVITLDYNTVAKKRPESKNAILTSVFESVDFGLRPHEEDHYVDFDYERNLPMKLSQEGPDLIVGDFNMDGIDDIVISGARGQKTALYLGQSDGTFVDSDGGDLTFYHEFEDVCMVSFDANNDGFPDILIGSGGNFQKSNTREMQDRLYINDGNAKFTLKTDAFPVNGMNTAVIVPFDFNNDGNIDVFVGSRSVPLQYGVAPRSYLYQNDGNGKFKDVTHDIGPDIAEIGMVCDATLADITNNGIPELIIVGEWMSPQIFESKDNTFKPVKNNPLEDKKGYWYSIATADLTGNGTDDLILGNRGTNSYLGSRDDLPIKLYLADFDQRNTLDKIMTRHVNGHDVPVLMKRELTISLPGLKKESLTHHLFAEKSIHDLFGKRSTEQAMVKEINFLKSIVLLNHNNAEYDVIPLPVDAQLSNIHSITTHDINFDGLPDIICGGNLFTYPPQFSRLDANHGTVLINRNNGRFESLPGSQSGLRIFGQMKAIDKLVHNEEVYFIFSINNKAAAVYKFNEEWETTSKFPL